jgi:hypothetical protein
LRASAAPTVAASSRVKPRPTMRASALRRWPSGSAAIASRARAQRRSPVAHRLHVEVGAGRHGDGTSRGARRPREEHQRGIVRAGCDAEDEPGNRDRAVLHPERDVADGALEARADTAPPPAGALNGHDRASIGRGRLGPPGPNGPRGADRSTLPETDGRRRATSAVGMSADAGTTRALVVPARSGP